MQWDLGFGGLALLALMSVVGGICAQLIVNTRGARWVAPAFAGAYFVLGLVVSEVWFGWATEEELQPNIDGLSFDEVLLAALPVFVGALVVRRWVRGRRPHADRTGHGLPAARV
jgi:hypothetical protein